MQICFFECIDVRSVQSVRLQHHSRIAELYVFKSQGPLFGLVDYIQDMNLSPLPIQKFFANNGRPLINGRLFTYEGGNVDSSCHYTDADGGTANTNPIVLNFRGECRVWIDPQQAYKFILAPLRE